MYTTHSLRFTSFIWRQCIWWVIGAVKWFALRLAATHV